MHQLTDKVIILKTIKHLESNLIVYALNSQGAKLHLFAPSALKSRRRFGGAVLEPLNVVQIVYRPAGKESVDSLGQLKEAMFLSSFPKLRTDYERLELAFYFVKLILKVAQPDSLDSSALFNLLGHALKSLEISCDLEKLKVHFELKLLAIQGVLPQMPSSGDFLQTPLAKHGEIQIDPEPFLRLKLEVNQVLREYVS